MPDRPDRRLSALRADTFRRVGRCGIGAILHEAVTSRAFLPIVSLRMCQAAAAGGPSRPLLPLLRALHLLTTHNAAMDLPWRTSIAPGFAIDHGWGLVISSSARIGRNVTVMQGVTLGRRDRITKDRGRLTDHPVIGDDVWIGPNATIVGGVTIGRGSRIAAGALVTLDVPPYSVVVGNPGSVMRSDALPDVVNPIPA